MPRQGEGRHIQVNFDPALEALTREVSYLSKIPGLEMSSIALGIYQQNDFLRKQHTQLGVCTTMYNGTTPDSSPKGSIRNVWLE